MTAYLFGGVNGVGKSAIFEQIRKKRPEITIVHTATALMEWLAITPGNYATLRKLPTEHKNHETGKVIAHQISLLKPQDTIIFDFHYLNLINGHMSPTVEGNWLSKVDGLILVTAATDTIYERIKNDTRNRELFPRTMPEKEQKALLANFITATHQECERLAATFALPHIAVTNDKAELEKASDNVLHFIESQKDRRN